MFRISNLTKNQNINFIDDLGPFQILEYKKDLSVNPYTAANE